MIIEALDDLEVMLAAGLNLFVDDGRKTILKFRPTSIFHQEIQLGGDAIPISSKGLFRRAGFFRR